MYVIKADADIIRTEEVRGLRKDYYAKFGEFFIPFNYVDFRGIRGEAGSAAQQYKEALIEALKKDEPTRIESQWDGNA